MKELNIGDKVRGNHWIFVEEDLLLEVVGTPGMSSVDDYVFKVLEGDYKGCNQYCHAPWNEYVIFVEAAPYIPEIGDTVKLVRNDPLTDVFKVGTVGRIVGIDYIDETIDIKAPCPITGDSLDQWVYAANVKPFTPSGLVDLIQVPQEKLELTLDKATFTTKAGNKLTVKRSKCRHYYVKLDGTNQERVSLVEIKAMMEGMK